MSGVAGQPTRFDGSVVIVVLVGARVTHMLPVMSVVATGRPDRAGPLVLRARDVLRRRCEEISVRGCGRAVSRGPACPRARPASARMRKQYVLRMERWNQLILSQTPSVRMGDPPY